MLARLQMLLNGVGLTYKRSSNLQGALMEMLDTDYAEELHSQKMHPYSQYLVIENGNPVWYVNTLNHEAYEKIICKLMVASNEIDLHRFGKKHGMHVQIMKKKLFVKERSALLQEFYGTKANNPIEVDFLTPTAFRQNHRYVILPDVRLLCQNLMMKYSLSSGQVDMMDEEALGQIVEGSILVKHKIRSLPFPMEGTVIPGFVGNIVIRCRGTETMTRYLRMLLRFGEFSGAGVRTGMGMGAMRIGGMIGDGGEIEASCGRGAAP